MPAKVLQDLNLAADDIFEASDHAPVVADFAPAAPVLKINKTAATTELTIYLAPDRLLQVQRSDNLITWENFLPTLQSSTAPAVFTDRESVNSPHRFYRAASTE